MKKYISILLFPLITSCALYGYKCASLSGWCSNKTRPIVELWDLSEEQKQQYFPRPADTYRKAIENQNNYYSKIEIEMRNCGLDAWKGSGEQEITKAKEQCLLDKNLRKKDSF